jgi:hypothetical protein
MTEESRFASLKDDDILKIIHDKLPQMWYQVPLEFSMNIYRWKMDKLKP